MTAEEHRILIERLAQLKASPNCIRYHHQVPLGRKRGSQWVSVFGVHPTAEIFIEVSDGTITRVNHFFSRYKSLTPEERRLGISLVDDADAFALARRACIYWPDVPPPPGVVWPYRR